METIQVHLIIWTTFKSGFHSRISVIADSYTDDVFITWYLFSHAEWKSDKVMTCWEILAWEFYNVNAFAVFDKFV